MVLWIWKCISFLFIQNKNYYEKKIVKTDDQIENFIQDAQKNKIGWALDVT